MVRRASPIWPTWTPAVICFQKSVKTPRRVWQNTKDALSECSGRYLRIGWNGYSRSRRAISSSGAFKKLRLQRRRAHPYINSSFVDDFAKLHLAAEGMHVKGKGLPAGPHLRPPVHTCRRTIPTVVHYDLPFDYLPTDVAPRSKSSTRWS